jgi:hypothetical protein
LNQALYPFVCYLVGSLFFVLGTLIAMRQMPDPAAVEAAHETRIKEIVCYALVATGTVRSCSYDTEKK